MSPEERQVAALAFTAEHSVLAQEGTLWVLEVPPPDAVSGDDGVLPKLAAWAVEHAPGRMATALRVAMGDNGPTYDNGPIQENGGERR